MNSKKAQILWRKLFGWKIGDKCRVPFGYSRNRRCYLYAKIIGITLVNSHAFVEVSSTDRPERSSLVYDIDILKEDYRE